MVILSYSPRLSLSLSLSPPHFSLNLSDSDMLTILDGDEVTTHILGQYVGGAGPFKIQSTTPDLTVTFHSDPAGLVFGKGEGFIINYMEVSRNDSCPDLPEIQNGWKTTSHTALVRGARITYQCDPGYDLVGRETLTCQLDLTWSTQPPLLREDNVLFRSGSRGTLYQVTVRPETPGGDHHPLQLLPRLHPAGRCHTHLLRTRAWHPCLDVQTTPLCL
ncbi:unnamed protein product [Oncorhynchus mykiss]|uniref:Sushi domain-containing protein n=1 Tax=Oncorhynchus mykiss TaxID=8022 RepID=A0A060ZKG8_ONCMY|nr:unnamed protein product [Oncorhynchus mykiss]